MGGFASGAYSSGFAPRHGPGIGAPACHYHDGPRKPMNSLNQA